MNKIGIAGNCGKEDRSDCQIILELTESGGIQVELTSKVKRLYGKSIEADCRKGLDFFGIINALVKINDNGALPFTLAARLESAVRQVTETDKEFLPPFLPQNNYATTRDCWRRARLYLPGNSPKLTINAGLHKADGFILDLEDSVSPLKKDEARLLVRNTLRQVDFYGAERMVRINQIPRGLEDLKFVIPYNVNLILIPKCESVDQVKQVDNEIKRIANEYKLTNPVWLMPIIESALGVIRAYEIAIASPNVVALAIGLEDYTADLGTQRTTEGRESLYARQALLNAARAAGVQAIDSVFSDVADLEALQKAVQESKALGFDGMGCIHPRQIKVVQDNYAPDAAAIDKARKIVKAFEEAEQKGQGVVALGSKMIDPPIVKRALRTIKLAESLGLLNANWREEIQ